MGLFSCFDNIGLRNIHHLQGLSDQALKCYARLKHFIFSNSRDEDDHVKASILLSKS